MTAQINSDTLLDTFDLVKGILRTNTTLNTKFDDNDYYEFMPNVKGLGGSFFGFPFCVINIPMTDDPMEYIGNYSTEKDFEIEIDFYLNFLARDKLKTYLSTAMKTLRAANDTFKTYGYNIVKVTLPAQPLVDLIDENQVVRGTISLTLSGEVNV